MKTSPFSDRSDTYRSDTCRFHFHLRAGFYMIASAILAIAVVIVAIHMEATVKPTLNEFDGKEQRSGKSLDQTSSSSLDQT